MENKGKVAGGDFPEGSSIDLVRTGRGYNVQVSYREGSSRRSFLLKGKVHSLKVLRDQMPDGSLSPLESGIIGGSVTGIPGFLGAYLSAKEPDGVIFLCMLIDGRHFYGYCSRLFYENMRSILTGKKKYYQSGCLVSVFSAALFMVKKILGIVF
jgi:hypothetical protein